jgi:hypothetical protein
VLTCAWPNIACTSDSGKRLDRDRAEHVAEVVEADRGDAGPLQRSLVAAAQERVVLELADDVGEYEIVGVGEQVALGELGERHRVLLGEASRVSSAETRTAARVRCSLRRSSTSFSRFSTANTSSATRFTCCSSSPLRLGPGRVRRSKTASRSSVRPAEAARASSSVREWLSLTSSSKYCWTG